MTGLFFALASGTPEDRAIAGDTMAHSVRGKKRKGNVENHKSTVYPVRPVPRDSRFHQDRLYRAAIAMCLRLSAPPTFHRETQNCTNL